MRLTKPLLKVMEWLTALFIFLMMALTFVDVVGRYLFDAPIFGASEMIQFLLAASIFSAMGIVSARDGHIAVELFTPRLEHSFPKLQPLIVRAFSVAGLALIGFELGRIGLEALHVNHVTIVLEWPIAMIAIPSSILCILAALFQLSAPRTNA